LDVDYEEVDKINNKYMRRLKLENRTINYVVRRMKRKTIAVKIREEGYIEIVSPLRVSCEYIEDLLRKKEQWVLGTLDKIILEKERREKNTTTLFLGKEYDLVKSKSLTNKTSVEILSNKIMVNYLIDENESLEILRRWYINAAGEILNKKTKKFSRILNVSPNKISIKEQKTRYGSCSSKKNINYNWKIIMAPEEVVDYLVVHELSHLVHFNHQKEFWELVQSIIPDYRQCRDYLKYNGDKLKI